MKQPIIIFEGVDKSGKTTLLNLFNKYTDFKYIVLDRFTTSSKVYDVIFDRNSKEYYKNVENKFFEDYNVTIVFCYCNNINEIQKRLLEANEKLPAELQDIAMVQNLFKMEIMLRKKKNDCNIVEIDTSKNVVICLAKILEEVDIYGYSKNKNCV